MISKNIYLMVTDLRMNVNVCPPGSPNNLHYLYLSLVREIWIKVLLFSDPCLPMWNRCKKLCNIAIFSFTRFRHTIII